MAKIERSARRREAHRVILQRSRERRRAGRRIALVEYDESVVDMLVRRGWLKDGEANVANAIQCLLKSLAEMGLLDADKSVK
jgi:hypothetical protein